MPGGFYHVTLRGNHREPIFDCSADRDLLDAIVADTVDLFGLRIHAYCWMTNHLHLLIQIADEPVGRAVHRIASQYARKFQRRLETTGHLFERRYHGVIVDADRYLLTLVRYIHLNPVSAGLARDPLEYRWSSHRNYMGLPGAQWVTTEFVLDLLGATRERAVAAYCKLIGSAAQGSLDPSELLPNPRFGNILGDDVFAARIDKDARRPRTTKSLDSLMVECSVRFNITGEQIASRAKSRRLATARAWLAHEVVAERVATISALARRLNRSESSLRQLLLRHPRAVDPDKPG